MRHVLLSAPLCGYSTILPYAVFNLALLHIKDCLQERQFCQSHNHLVDFQLLSWTFFNREHALPRL